MFSMIATVITIGFLLALGLYSGAIRKSISLAAGFLRNSYGLTETKLQEREKRDELTKEMRAVFPEVKEMRRSKENSQKITCVSYVGICLITLSLLILFLNFEWTTGQMITQWLAEKLPMADGDNITIYMTSIMFSMLTSGVSMVINQWKKSYRYRKEQSAKKIREAAKRELSEEELLSIVAEKVSYKKEAYEK